MIVGDNPKGSVGSQSRRKRVAEQDAMTRSALIDALAQEQKIPRAMAERVVLVFFEQIEEALCAGNRVEIRGLGSFQLRHYDGYTGRNPHTGSTVQVRPKILPVFRTGKEIRVRLAEQGPPPSKESP